MTIDQNKLEQFMGKALGDMSAAASAVMVLIGDQLGLYRMMADSGAVTPAELAKKTRTRERYIREWLNNQTAGGYVSYDPQMGRYSLPEEQAMALAQEGSPCFIPGAFQVIKAMFAAEPTMVKNFKTGKGLPWSGHHKALYEGTERFFRPGYAAHLTSSWIPALAGVESRLKEGIRVADVGCGLGASTIVMAKAYPRSKFFGFDYHGASIQTAKKRAKDAGVADRVTFTIAKAANYPGRDYGLVTHFDCLHDMGDPEGAARHVRETIASDGCWMLVEPFAGDKVEENIGPVGRMFYAASTMLCVPNAISQKGEGLGAQAGEARLRSIMRKAGFSQVRRATHTPFNLILEAKP